ncbi:HEAT repeat domain-containing protein [Corallococcus sp. AB049A]|uniref:HEAT repeat domain-containing protein n=1 Tax=Corallococcus interemptor TaxID=2316720 RepID=A0A3A8QIY0_9BACT|nr:MULTISPECIES: HEAT repeat domain-containing protein [Corallococcus]RKH46785.1 HEAT repeat domain-containing protein [Corallococcus sp. AB050B]RKH68709.1 HEAT repeat domain-containing protein [Corallococcus interemptor]RKI63840.1 HEAT repeat domain-containing protein [Corallococcus sp. AB049A]
MRPLLAAALLLTAAAHAQAPSTPAATAPKAAPKADKAPADPRAQDDSLLKGLLWAAEPAPEEIRALAIEDLALLGDTRALDPLAAFIWDPNPRIQQAALRAVALFQHRRAEEILGNVVRHPRLPDTLKIQALSGLLYQRTATARRVVQDVAADSRVGYAVQNAARSVASQWDAAPAAAP